MPLVRRTHVWSGRRRVIETPLFPSYVFVQATQEATYVAIDSGRVVRRIAISDQQRFTWELCQLQQALAQEESFDPYPYLKEGVWVRVCSGPLRGVEGLVDIRKSRDRLVLQIEALGRATSLEIDAHLLDAVG